MFDQTVWVNSRLKTENYCSVPFCENFFISLVGWCQLWNLCVDIFFEPPVPKLVHIRHRFWTCYVWFSNLVSSGRGLEVCPPPSPKKTINCGKNPPLSGPPPTTRKKTRDFSPATTCNMGRDDKSLTDKNRGRCTRKKRRIIIVYTLPIWHDALQTRRRRGRVEEELVPRRQSKSHGLKLEISLSRSIRCFAVHSLRGNENAK